jgi:uncharacterized protein
VLVADSGGIYGLYNRDDKHHHALAEAIAAESGPIVIPSAILAEIDFMLISRLGAKAEDRFLDAILQGIFTISQFTLEDAAACKDLLLRYHDLDLGLADAAVIATADRLGTARILTVDMRDFRAVRSKKGKPFELVPGSIARRKP